MTSDYRWKEECTSIAQKYENKLTELRGETSQLKKRNKEVTHLLKDSQEKTLQVFVVYVDADYFWKEWTWHVNLDHL